VTVSEPVSTPVQQNIPVTKKYNVADYGIPVVASVQQIAAMSPEQYVHQYVSVMGDCGPGVTPVQQDNLVTMEPTVAD